MSLEEAQRIIAALYSAKKYFKPLPYSQVIGGTTISYDAHKKRFKEHYLNESVWDRGREEFTKYYSEAALIEMFTEEKYTDQKYPIPKKSEEYRLED